MAEFTRSRDSRVVVTEPKLGLTVLTGAGASQPLGLPTMDALLPKGFDSELQGEERDIFDMAANWATLQNPSLLDFELVFTLVDTVAHLRESDPVAMAFAAPRSSAGGFLFRQATGGQIMNNLSSYRRAGTSLLERLKRVVHERLERPDPVRAVTLYHHLFRVLGAVTDPPGLIEVFTTNYDRGVEVSHELSSDEDPQHLQFELVRGFTRTRNARAPRWNPGAYDDAAGNRLTVRLYKLHGSLDWRRNGDVVEEVAADEYVRGRNAVIYPIRKPRFEEPFKTLFERFRHQLERSRVCVVIGSSLRDEHLREALVDQVKRGTLRVVLADPRAKEVAELLRADLPIERSAHLLFVSNTHFGGTPEEDDEFEAKVREAVNDARLSRG